MDYNMIESLFEILTKANRFRIKLKNRLKYIFILKHLGKGSYIRRGVKISGNPKRIEIGSSFQVYENCFFGVSKNGYIELGDDGLLGVGCYLNASAGKIKIGNNIAIGPYCKFFSYSHHYRLGENCTTVSITGDIIIENNVFIGTNVVILPGVRVGKNSVIAAGAVVNKDVEENVIVGGIPAKIIKRINESSHRLQREH
jgi:acetyltransferase-like isoleucine patch superfamily enzyme